MMLKSRFQLRPARKLAVWVLTVSFSLGSGASLLAQAPYLPAGHPDSIALLPPPPAVGSREEEADLAAVRAVFRGRTPAEEKRAVTDSSLAFSLFAPAIGPEFKPDNLPKTFALLQGVKKEIGGVIDTPKDFYKRRRPYLLDSSLSLGQPEPSFSYPSGHSTRGTVYALVLAEIFPAHRDSILEIGRNIGWDRVLIGKHFPSDVYAGRVLGQAIMRDLKSSEAFMHALAEARAEADKAQTAPALRAAQVAEPSTAGAAQ
jgi:acid phosphatase (class A)